MTITYTCDHCGGAADEKTYAVQIFEVVPCGAEPFDGGVCHDTELCKDCLDELRSLVLTFIGDLGASATSLIGKVSVGYGRGAIPDDA